MITISEDIELEGLDSSLGKLFKKKKRKKAVAQVTEAAKSVLGVRKDKGVPGAPSDDVDMPHEPGGGAPVTAPTFGPGVDWWLVGGVGVVVLGLAAFLILRK